MTVQAVATTDGRSIVPSSVFSQSHVHPPGLFADQAKLSLTQARSGDEIVVKKKNMVAELGCFRGVSAQTAIETIEKQSTVTGSAEFPVCRID